jgi:hypothetical protein
MKRIVCSRVFSILTCMVLALSSAAFGHDGHKAPTQAMAPNGGSMKGTKNLFVEVVYDGGKLKIFLFDHDMKKVTPSTVKVSASFKLPKASKSSDLKLTQVGDSLESSVDVKGSHRFSVNLTIVQDGKSDKLSFNIEP